VLCGLLLQRGIFLLHACALAWDAGAILIAGVSGAGKSTLAAALVQQGCRLLSDDISLVTMAEDGAIVHPGTPQIRLWRESLDLLGIAEPGLTRVCTGEEKFYWPVGASFEPTPRRVLAFIELAVAQGAGCTITKISGVERLKMLVAHTYRGECLDYVAPREKQISFLTSLLGSFPQYTTSRSANGDSACWLARSILEFLKGESTWQTRSATRL
jgi:hypothetical protein